MFYIAKRLANQACFPTFWKGGSTEFHPLLPGRSVFKLFLWKSADWQLTLVCSARIIVDITRETFLRFEHNFFHSGGICMCICYFMVLIFAKESRWFRVKLYFRYDRVGRKSDICKRLRMFLFFVKFSYHVYTYDNFLIAQLLLICFTALLIDTCFYEVFIRRR